MVVKMLVPEVEGLKAECLKIRKFEGSNRFEVGEVASLNSV